MANAFLEKVRLQREAEQEEQERLRELDRQERLQQRLLLIRAAGERQNELLRERRANGLPPPARRRSRRAPFKPPASGAGPEFHDVQVGDLPNFRLEDGE